MAGISSKAAGSLTNRYKYNSYELDADLDLNLDESFYPPLWCKHIKKLPGARV
jgi:hypothetical protein